MIRTDKNIYESMQRRLGALDKRRRALVLRIRELAEQISDLGLPVDIRPQPVTVESGTALSGMQDVGLGRNASVSAQYRDFVIRCHRQLSNEDLCKRLDFYLELVRDQAAIGLPENWSSRFGVNTYSEAYRNTKCRNLVQKLIAEAKREL